jgi:hypothetical protein
MKKLIMAAAILGASVSGAEAAVMNINGVHTAPNALEYYYFQNNSLGNVQIVMDTLTDGFDATLAVWQKVVGSTVVGQPENSDWALVDISYAADRDANELNPTVSVNNFGIPFRNGYNPLDITTTTGTSDPGMIMSNLAQGIYLIEISANFNDPNVNFAGDLMSLGHLGFEQFSEINTWPHNYTFSITGNVSEVSQVPVPAAVWLFGSALAGLGAISRKKSAMAA